MEFYIDKEWIKEYMCIPMEYRCNPYDCSPSGDLYFADKRNLDHIDKAMEQCSAASILAESDKKRIFDMDDDS